MKMNIVQNKARCRACGTVLRSFDSSASEVLWCECGAIGISGGLQHLHRYGDPKLTEELSLELVNGKVQKVEPPQQKNRSLYDDGELEEWKAMPYSQRKAAIKARAWLPQPTATDIRLEYGVIDHGVPEVESKVMPSLEEAVKEARRRYIETALANPIGENEALALTSVFEVTIKPIPFMTCGVLHDDADEAVCPRCGETVTKAELCDELGLCTGCVKSILRERAEAHAGAGSGHTSGSQQSRRRSIRRDGIHTGPTTAKRLIRNGKWYGYEGD